MLDQWLKFWRQWMFWWLPGGDEPAKDKPAQDRKQQPAASPDDAAEDMDAAATWQPVTPNDFTVIHGIGPAIARRLDALGVRTFADLAAADPEDLAEKIAKRPVTADRVRECIAEAKKRAS